MTWASQVAQLVKNPPAMQETLVSFLGRADPLEKGKATHSSIQAWRSPWTKEPGRLQSMGSHRVGHNWATFTFHFAIGFKTFCSLWSLPNRSYPGRGTILILLHTVLGLTCQVCESQTGEGGREDGMGWGRWQWTWRPSWSPDNCASALPASLGESGARISIKSLNPSPEPEELKRD